MHGGRRGWYLEWQTETPRALQTLRVIRRFSPSLFADSLSPPVNVTITAVKANSAVVTWDIPEGDPVIGFAITQQVSRTRARVAFIGLIIQQ